MGFEPTPVASRATVLNKLGSHRVYFSSEVHSVSGLELEEEEESDGETLEEDAEDESFMEDSGSDDADFEIRPKRHYSTHEEIRLVCCS